MMYEFLVSMNGGRVSTVRFFASSLEEAKKKCKEWCGEYGHIIDHVGTWHVTD